MASSNDADRAWRRRANATAESSPDGLDRHEWERLIQQSVDPDRCPICGQIWDLVVGCHKACRCGNMEGCGD